MASSDESPFSPPAFVVPSGVPCHCGTRWRDRGNLDQLPTHWHIHANPASAGAFPYNLRGASAESVWKRRRRRMTLSGLGEIVSACWARLPEHFPNASIQEFIVMPKHLHGNIALGVEARYIVPFDPQARKPERIWRQVTDSVPTIVRTLKAAVTRQAREALEIRLATIWQRNHFEGIVCDGEEYAATCRYIVEISVRQVKPGASSG